MNLQNGYRVVYEKTAGGVRTFYATKNFVCDPAIDDKIVEATIGEYKLIYEKKGQFYGSTTGIPTENDHCFTEFDKVFKVVTENAVDQDTTPVVEEPTTPVVEPEVSTTEEDDDEPIVEPVDEE